MIDFPADDSTSDDDAAVRVVPEPSTECYECFDCNKRIWTKAPLSSCLECGSVENFYLMD
jgi:hypothetical protein